MKSARSIKCEGQVKYGDTMKAHILDEDTISSVKIKDVDGLYYEMQSEYYSFAIPYDIEKTKQWSYKNYNFNIVQQSEINLLEQKRSVFTIKVQGVGERETTWILYSIEKGILAFSRNVVDMVFSFENCLITESPLFVILKIID